MTRFSSHCSVALKTAALISAVTVGTLPLVGCGQSNTPTATLNSPTSTVQQAAQPESPTLKNLQAAYNGESNAHVMYLAFAKKAGEEGYRDVANLFTTVARAEEIHRDNHAKVIRAMGASPKNNIAIPEVKSTADNLDKAIGKGNLSKAIKGESYERDSMYPKFLREAKAEGKQAAVQTFDYALAAETQHAKLYTEVKANLNNWKQASRHFYVCTDSGETFINQPSANRCPQTNLSKSDKAVEKVI